MEDADITYQTEIRVHTKNGPVLCLREHLGATGDLIKFDIIRGAGNGPVYINKDEALELARMFNSFGRTAKLPVGDDEKAPDDVIAIGPEHLAKLAEMRAQQQTKSTRWRHYFLDDSDPSETLTLCGKPYVQEVDVSADEILGGVVRVRPADCTPCRMKLPELLRKAPDPKAEVPKPSILTVMQLCAALGKRGPEDEVWVNWGTWVAPIVAVGNFGPDSSGQRDGALLTVRHVPGTAMVKMRSPSGENASGESFEQWWERKGMLGPNYGRKVAMQAGWEGALGMSRSPVDPKTHSSEDIPVVRGETEAKAAADWIDSARAVLGEYHKEGNCAASGLWMSHPDTDFLRRLRLPLGDTV